MAFFLLQIHEFGSLWPYPHSEFWSQMDPTDPQFQDRRKILAQFQPLLWKNLVIMPHPIVGIFFVCFIFLTLF